MERNYNASGADRKELVRVIGEALGMKPKYMGVPSFAYQIGGYEVSKHGVLTFEENGETASVLAAIETAGFTAEQDTPEATTEPQESETTESIPNIPQEAERLKTSHRRQERTPSAFPSACRGKPSPTPHWKIWMPCSNARETSSGWHLASRRRATR